jgi:DNA-binding beta-propeller fold protein YncE
MSSPWDVANDASGNVYTMNESTNTIYKISPAGNITTFATVPVPTGIAVDGSGNVYVSAFNAGSVYKFGPTGTQIAIITGFNSPYGIAIDNANNAYVVNSGTNTILKITAGGTTSATFSTPTLPQPYGIAIDPSNNVYVSQYATTGTVIKFSLGSTAITKTFTGFNAPRQLGSDASGNIYIADYGNNVIKEIAAGTNAANGATTFVPSSAGLSTPRAVSLDGSGNIYVADYGNNAIKKIALKLYAISPALPTGLNFDTSTGTISGTPTTTFTATNYTVTATNGSGTSNTTIILSCTQNVDWIGGNNAITGIQWARAANWSNNAIPSATDNVRIGVASFNGKQPTISTAVTVNSITFGNATNPTLTITGAGSLTAASTMTVNTGTPATIVGSATGAAVNLSPGSSLNINGTGTLTLTNPLSFTLKSDATGDASVGQITQTSITGTAAASINVERYLAGGSITERSYRLLSSPVYASTITSGSLTDSVYSVNYIKNNSFLTGTDGIAGGFDATGNPTLWLFRENFTGTNLNFKSGNFRGVKNISGTPTYTIDNDAGNFNIPVGGGFLFFFRGSRATVNPFVTTTIPVAATLVSSGKLNAGTITFKTWFTPSSKLLSYTPASPVGIRGFNFAGNPYASAIDWDLFQTSSSGTGIYGANVSSTMYILDPVTKNYGAYTAGTNGVGSSSFISNVISSGQGFFVLATAANPQLIFNESAKTVLYNTGSKLLMGKPVNASSNQYIRLQMGTDSIHSDQTLVRFNSQSSLAYNPNTDALHIPGFGSVSLSSKSADLVDVSIKNMPLPKVQAEHLYLNVGANATGIYQLTLKNIVSIPRLYDVWLMDTYKNDSLDMRQNKTYSFNIYKTDSASFGNKRFYLSIQQNQAYAYRLISFTASKATDARQVNVLWNTANEENYTNFTVERSTDNGATFKVLGGVDAAGAGSYSFIDQSPATGTNLYRLKQEDINNTISYSKIVTIQYSTLSNGIVGSNLSIYPNPAIGNINLAIASQNNAANTYNIRFMSSSGIMVKEATSSQVNWQGSISNLQPGTYIIQVFENKTQRLVGQNKFVKL